MAFHENWYGEQQLAELVKLAKKVYALHGSIIEIGCWEGRSTIAIANAIYPEILLCNDTWEGNLAESQVSGKIHSTVTICQKRDVYKSFVENMNEFTKGNFKIIKEDCLRWLKSYRDPVKFCHIDASHDYESVSQTIKLLKPLIVNGGIMCGDDFATSHMKRSDLHGGVERAVREHFSDFKLLAKNNLWFWIKGKNNGKIKI